ncbi:MAG: mechanosensitive ion channel [Candidatus Portnoybacteria bacterium]|nr:mechanosensitive ion channel [Candidatus Portnoybacteria bacterium]
MGNIQLFILDLIKTYGADVVWIIALFFLGRIILRKIVKRTIKISLGENQKSQAQLKKRAETLGSILIATGNAIIYIIILLMTLNLFGINIAPILAGAGIIGLAVGFGAQSLVKDFVSGLFILLENQYSVGDKVKIGNFEGEVLKITMRSTILRDQEGKTFYISNGLIKDVTNFSQSQ